MVILNTIKLKLFRVQFVKLFHILFRTSFNWYSTGHVLFWKTQHCQHNENHIKIIHNRIIRHAQLHAFIFYGHFKNAVQPTRRDLAQNGTVPEGCRYERRKKKTKNETGSQRDRLRFVFRGFRTKSTFLGHKIQLLRPLCVRVFAGKLKARWKCATRPVVDANVSLTIFAMFVAMCDFVIFHGNS